MKEKSDKLDGKKRIKIYTQDEAERSWDDYFDYAEDYFFEISEEAQRELLERRESDDSKDPNSLYPSLILEYIKQNKVNFGFISGSSKKTDKGYCSEICLELKRSIKDLGYGSIEMRAISENGSVFNLLFIPLIKKDELIKLAKECKKKFIFYSEISNFSEMEIMHDDVCRIMNNYSLDEKNNVELFRDILTNFSKKLLEIGSCEDETFIFQEREVPNFNRIAYSKEKLKWLKMFT